MVRLGLSAFSYYDVAIHEWDFARGESSILIGSSSTDIRLQGMNPLAPGQENHQQIS
jgi:hypothetical protein